MTATLLNDTPTPPADALLIDAYSNAVSGGSLGGQSRRRAHRGSGRGKRRPAGTGVSGVSSSLPTAACVLTNSHVAVQGTQRRVFLADGRKLPRADLVGDEIRTPDLAVLRVSADDIAHLPVSAIAAAVRPGQIAIAIGSPAWVSSRPSPPGS